MLKRQNLGSQDEMWERVLRRTFAWGIYMAQKSVQRPAYTDRTGGNVSVDVYSTSKLRCITVCIEKEFRRVEYSF